MTMKLAFVFPPMLVGGRPLDFDRLWDDPRGLTGSEMMTLSFARECAERHDVYLFIPDAKVDKFCSVSVVDFSKLSGMAESFDAVLCALDVNVFRGISRKPLRVLLQQINGFEYTGQDFDSFVDLYISPSQPHLDMMTSQWPTKKEKWAVVPNGCYPVPSEARLLPKIPGRVIYPSSPDRGLHLLLQEWTAIRRAVPHAHLKIFYYSLERWLAEWRPRSEDPTWQTHWKEHCRRAKYIDMALGQLKSKGVEVVGSVSRNEMASEMLAAEVLAYPCDVIAWTEGFSCATMEGCAAGAIPVISDVDALGHIYGNSTPMVPSPAHKHMKEWRDLVIAALTKPEHAAAWRSSGRALAKKHDWRILAEKLENVIQERLNQ